VFMFAAPHPPQRAGLQDEVGRQGPVNRSCTMRVIVSLVSGLPPMWLSRTYDGGACATGCKQNTHMPSPQSLGTHFLSLARSHTHTHTHAHTNLRTFTQTHSPRRTSASKEPRERNHDVGFRFGTDLVCT
jgi:hypothetical protein